MKMRISVGRMGLLGKPLVRVAGLEVWNMGGRRWVARSRVRLKGGRPKSAAPPPDKYHHTIQLPATSMPFRLKGQEVVETEKHIQQVAGFSSLYGWQRQQQRPQEYVLHDGPPYANGPSHIGHALNKILKDITVRHKLLQGYKVHYVPGWDCHGLPIELKSSQDSQGAQPDPLTIRASARRFALESVEVQKAGFERWGVMGDWSHPYLTLSPEYITQQLRLFADLYQAGYVYQDYKPVYFSPSSHTTLAEAELEYNSQHKSPSLYLGLAATALPPTLQTAAQSAGLQQVHLGVWTTTPWTLPLNEAVCFAPDKNYVLVVVDRPGGSGRLGLVWAEELVQELSKVLGQDVEVLATFPGGQLGEVRYQHPLREGEQCGLFPGPHVTTDAGSGLVHTAPAHGHDDFLLALRHSLPVRCQVDEVGCYQESVGPELAGLEVLQQGNDAVISLLRRQEGVGGAVVLSLDSLTHSYPYDWRTKQPVIIRASRQWFINLEGLRDKAMAALKEVKILPKMCERMMEGPLLERPYWCISRQRVWGVPLPVFYQADTGSPVIDRDIIEHVAGVLGREGCDAWWRLPEDQLLPPHLVQEAHHRGTPLPCKGTDIMDIWLDSGSSWAGVLGGRRADLYLEGIDQFRGWFHSSLLTAVAATGLPPYKSLFVHGFALDEYGKKMSKSEGNVVDPTLVTDGGTDPRHHPVYGADVLRWWVAVQTANPLDVTIGARVLQCRQEEVAKLRSVMRFLLACLGDYDPVQHSLATTDLRPLDQYLLHLLHHHIHKVWQNYEEFNYNNVVRFSIDFINNTVSAFYIAAVKDRLYCGSRWGTPRMSALEVLHHLLHHLLFSLAPILPHLAEEVAFHHSRGQGEGVFRQVRQLPPASWHQPQLDQTFTQLLTLRDSLHHQLRGKKPQRYQVTLTACGSQLDALQVLQTTQQSSESGLCELLQVAQVTLLPGTGNCEDVTMTVTEVKTKPCVRCRRFTAGGEELCGRCQQVLKH